MASTSGMLGRNASGPDELGILAIALFKDPGATLANLPSLIKNVSIQDALTRFNRTSKGLT
eukprot:1466593-Rhodomonas_salina.1